MLKFRRLLPLGAMAILLLAAMTPANAQVLYGSIVGAVEDPTGAVVPKANITLVSKETGQTREIATDDAGRFSLPNVLPGVYDLKTVATGFKPVTRTGIEVVINTVSRVDVKLEVGSMTEAVTVAAAAVQLQTDKADVRSELTATAMSNLPLPGYRNYQSLLNLVPGATPAAFQNAVVDSPARALRSFVNGTATNNNNTLTDGAANIFIWLPHHTVYVQPVESIETVNVTTGSFDAEQGMAGGAAVTVATKSGTNDIHGTAFWFHNNQHFNSAAYFKTSTYRKPISAFNQGGGTVGGPIKRDKLFYFFSFEKTWERTGYYSDVSVPPTAWRQGDFSAWKDYATIYDPASATDHTKRTPFPDNKIPSDRLSPIFQKIMTGLPAPNQTSISDPLNLSGNYGVSKSLKLDRNNYDVKVNWSFSPNLAIWGKYSRMDAPVTGAYAFGDLGGPVLGSHGFGDTNVNMPTIGYSYTFSPTFLMDGVFGYTRMDQIVSIPGQDKNVGLDVWGVPGTNGGRQFANDERYGGLPSVTFGFSNVGVDATWAPLFRNDRSYTYSTNFTKLHGAHEIRWGFEPRRHSMNHWQPEVQNPRGTINFGSGATRIPGVTGRTAHTFASALLGLVSDYNKSIQFFDMKTREWQLAWYVRDRWQVNRKLTVSIGLRYEYYPLINRGDRGIERWDPYTNVVYLGGLGQTPRSAGIEVSKKLFAPRLGFAYRVTDNWVIRSGYGLTYDPLPFSRPLRGLYPSTLAGAWNAGTEGAEFRESTYGWFNRLSAGIPDVPTPDVSKGTVQLPLNLDMGPRSAWGGMLNRGYIQSWNFTVERKLPWEMVGSAAYVGTKTVHQLMDRNINTAGPGTLSSADLPLAKLYGKTAAAWMWDGIGTGSYHSLQTQLNKSFTSGLMLKGSYTWSKTLTYADEDGWTNLPYWNWEPMMRRNYSPSSYDRRHMFALAWLYEFPVGKGKKFNMDGPLNYVLGGWRVSGQFFAYSGSPFNITVSGDSLRCQGTTACTQTPFVFGDPTIIDTERGPGKRYMDPTAFVDPLWLFDTKNPKYISGTLGRHALYGPGFWRMDPMLSKTIQITERFKTEFRAEAANITNTPRWNNPSTGMSDIQRNAAGQVTDYRNFLAITGVNTADHGPRQIRFGLRLEF